MKRAKAEVAFGHINMGFELPALQHQQLEAPDVVEGSNALVPYCLLWAEIRLHISSVFTSGTCANWFD